jgi:hypothetical protein
MSSPDVRQTLHSVYSALRSDATSKAFATYTIDHALQAQIDYLIGSPRKDILDTGGESVLRPSKLDELVSLQNDMAQLVAQLKVESND